MTGKAHMDKIKNHVLQSVFSYEMSGLNCRTVFASGTIVM